MRTVNTEKSVYEIDETKKLIRRREGLSLPTPRQGNDGEWKEYICISVSPAYMIIQWGWNNNGTARCTITSRVVFDTYDL